ncbi:DUF4328 domain-containing protein [Streptomyces sp. LN785]|uniref:DUF4328 domain-containing protein n=1 Tax=Streptomyces sp. LN785 TaxID=3112983 RepID=UPI003717EB96
MLCSTCRIRPSVTAEGRCLSCAGPVATAAPAPAAPLFTAPQQRLRSPDGLARAVVVLLVIAVVADLLSVLAGLNIRSLFNGIAMPDGAEASRADNLYAATGVLQVLVLLATAAVFIIWFRRVRLNAEVFDACAQPMKPGWAVGAWFVPVANLVLPRRIAGGIWTTSAQTNTDGTWRSVSLAPVNLWWGAWIFSTFFSRYASQKYSDAGNAQEVVDAVGPMLAADVLDMVAAGLAILFVRKLTRMQGERAALGHPVC